LKSLPPVLVSRPVKIVFNLKFGTFSSAEILLDDESYSKFLEE